jgi:ABC-type cobalamin/Fe3+-siderophores transport system ATPase subunit
MIGHDLTLAHGVSTHALLLKGDGRWLAGTTAEVMQPISSASISAIRSKSSARQAQHLYPQRGT